MSEITGCRLTRRQIEVIQTMIDRGTTCRETLADLLFVSSDTVKSHIQNAMLRKRVHSTAMLIVAALKSGEAVIDGI